MGTPTGFDLWPLFENYVQTHAFQVDITNREKVHELAAKIDSEIGPVDILINNAAIINSSEFLNTDDKRTDKLIDVNIKSVLWVTFRRRLTRNLQVTKAFLPSIIKRKSGHIVTISSVAGFVGASGREKQMI